MGFSHLLEPIQFYCIIHRLPPFSALLVRENTGLPGDGFVLGERCSGRASAVLR
jgi:hypothetical protein